MKQLSPSAALFALTLSYAAPALADNTSLPWEKDYPAALAKAKAEKRPLFLMLTATWCGPCKMLESHTLPAPNVLSGLKEFVWVKAYEDEHLNKRFNLGGYPTLVFLDASGERVLEKTVGYQQPAPFLRHVLVARRAAGLPLSKEMQDMQAKAFAPDEARIQGFTARGDADGLAKYLAPAREDLLREGNFLVARLRLPPGVKPEDVQATTYSDLPVPDSGVLLVGVPRDGSPVPLRIVAPGCKGIEEKISVEENTAVAVREFALRLLSASEAAVFSGRVIGPDGRGVPKALVRICDWDVTRADDQGRFKFERVSPGTFLVRAEAPGGELQKELNFEAGKELSQDLRLQAVTTVGIRWALQRKEGCRDLTGEGVRTGEAYFSVQHSRFLLSRGAEVPQYYGSDFMLMADWEGVRKFLPPERVAELESSNGGAPIFWLFDAGSHPNGLHAESAPFEAIHTINDGKPFDDKTYFKFLRGETVRKGRVYTVRCVRKDCYAKVEITDVTLVPKPPGK